jgi:hypothetical protein
MHQRIAIVAVMIVCAHLTAARAHSAQAADATLVFTPQSVLLASDSRDGAQFGEAVALDGDTALIAAPYADPEGTTGAAYVFVRSGGAWIEQAQLVGASAVFDGFGASVALSGDIAFVGAPGEDVGDGAVYVFQRIGTAPGAPTLNPPVVTGSTVALSWTAGSGGTPTGYTVIATATPNGAPIASVGLTGTSALFPNVPPGTYYLRLTASNAAGASAPSPQVTVTMP